jgi:type IV pilus assembly protein PilW
VYSRYPNNAGLTLVELLVAMVISVLVLGGVYQVFHGSTTTYRVQEGLSRLQENGRFAVDFLVKDIRLAGYQGCISNVSNFVNTLNSSDYVYDFTVGINGFEATGGSWNQTVDSSIVNPLPGSDIVTIRGLIGSSVSIGESMPTVSADLKTMPVPSGMTPPVEDWDVVLISDCTSNAAVFQITNYTVSNGNMVHNTGVGTPGNSTKDLGHKFEKGAEIVKIAATSYFISNSPAGQPSLYRRVGLNPSEEIIEGVQTMQILYGVDTDNDRSVDSYVAADAVSNWNSVLSVQIGLLMRTLEEIHRMEPDTATYTVLDQSFGPFNDRHLRRVFAATIGLRNRLR